MFCYAEQCGRNMLPKTPAWNWFGRSVATIQMWLFSPTLFSEEIQLPLHKARTVKRTPEMAIMTVAT
jgi:hypothetical protein